MISLKLQITVILVALLLLIIVIHGIRSGRLQLKHSLLWIFLGVINLLFALFPAATLYFTKLIGIELPVNAIFLTSIIVAYLLILQLSINGSSNELKKERLHRKLPSWKQSLDSLNSKLIN